MQTSYTRAPAGASGGTRMRPPIALFLTRVRDYSELPALATAHGFRSVVVPWASCEPGDGAVVTRNGWEVLADGTRAQLPLFSRFTPAVIGVLTPLSAAFERARALVTTCNALWAHAGAARAPQGRHPSGRYVSGIIDFQPHWAPLRAATINPSAHDALAHDALLAHIEQLNASLALADPVLHRTLAPCAGRQSGDGCEWFDPLLWVPRAEELSAWRSTLTAWIQLVLERVTVREPLRMPDEDDAYDPGDGAIHAGHFPELFGTARWIETATAPRASFVYLDPTLESDSTDLWQLLCRRRAADAVAGTEKRLIETGVGRACLVSGLRLTGAPQFHDFTVLGVGLTPFSEGGFVEIGREIDGKAAMLRARHRKRCAERLEAAGGRAARVVALAELPGDEIVMPDGSIAPAALIVRAFRCVLRVKQLDPLVCALHSPQHTPLIVEYLANRAREMRQARGDAGPAALHDDDQLAWIIERQPASQASLRELVAMPASRNLSDWPALVRRARLDVIEDYAPLLLSIARRRLALDWDCEEANIGDRDYLLWFAGTVAAQLRTWRRLRFLHDYHHPGFSRWYPGTLFSLGENNVTLLAEFADLDTAVFVDDPGEELQEILQLTPEDVAMLRERYLTLHSRDVQAVETVVRTLAAIVLREDAQTAAEVVEHFRRSLDHA